jgi:K+-sensing histidine kinase KdpD
MHVGEHAVLVGIQDVGPGIPADLHTRVFDRFFRGNQEADTSFKGAGLGLSIAKAIIESHGGSIELRAFAARPATICVTLPLTTVQEPRIVDRRKAI